MKIKNDIVNYFGKKFQIRPNVTAIPAVSVYKYNAYIIYSVSTTRYTDTVSLIRTLQYCVITLLHEAIRVRRFEWRGCTAAA